LGLALLGQLPSHRIGQCLQLATGDLGVVLPVHRPDALAALAAMFQAGHVTV
jgi:hypothetical protein